MRGERGWGRWDLMLTNKTVDEASAILLLICLHEVWVKVTYDWSTTLYLCLCLCQPRFHLSKLRHKHKHKHKKNKLVRFSCTYAYAYADAQAKTRVLRTKREENWTFWGSPFSITICLLMLSSGGLTKDLVCKIYFGIQNNVITE